jgi:LysM repeat protein
MRARISAVLIIIIILSAAVILTILLLGKDTPSLSPPTPTTTPTPQATETPTSTPTPSPVASPTPSGPFVYTVQEGDTLTAIAQTYGVSVEEIVAANNLADPNALQIGQTLIIPNVTPPTPTPSPPVEVSPGPSPTSAPPPTLLPTVTPSGPPLIEVAQVLGSGDLAAEVVIVRNRGGIASLERWTLSDAQGNTFTFPAITLFTDAEVRLHSTEGDNTPKDLYWGRTTPAWTGGELIALRDAEGNTVDTYIVP